MVLPGRTHFFEFAGLWKKMADKAVEVLVGSALPCGVGMREVVAQLQPTSYLLVQGELPTSTPIVRN